MLSYIEETEELVRDNILSKNEIFDYRDSPINFIYESFFEYCQEYLIHQCQEYQIQPARFFYRNEFSVNAMAAKLNNFFIIGINIGTIQTAYDMFYNKNRLFEDVSELSELCKKLSENSDISLGFLMFQLSIQFTFHHEVAHLIQKSPSLNLGISEKYNITLSNKEAIIEKHVHEFDSDLHGADAAFSKLLHHYERLPSKIQTRDNLVLLLSIGIASIYIYFILCLNRKQELYYLEFTHPHPIIRIAYVIHRFIKVADENLPINGKINPEHLTRLGFDVANQFLKSQESLGTKIEDEFSNQFQEKFDSIEKYVNDLMEYSKNFNNLLINRH